MPESIPVFLPWWGKPPGWERQFLERAAAIRYLRPVLVGDAAKWGPDVQVERIFCTMDEFENRASAVSGVQIKKVDPDYCRGQSLCELRPLMAEMFPEVIGSSAWWGYGDWDVVWGDWDAFLTDEMLSAYDLISTNAQTVNGPLTLFRNAPHVNTLYRARLDILECPLGKHHLDEGGLNEIVQAEMVAGRLRCLFPTGISGNDKDEVWNRCALRNGKLYRMDSFGTVGTEILKFHFPRTNAWPVKEMR